VFSSLLQFTSIDLKTLHTLSRLGSGVFFSNTLTLALFSMAGVPPFVGFFTKVFIFDLLADVDFFLFYLIAFLVLFAGLYFYIQNIRFLYGAHRSAFVPSVEFGVRTAPIYYYVTITALTFLVFGAFLLEEVLLWGRWLLV
jgi:NADH:ubiquinone oxidoreductase subunit 2 (subunit N)